MRNEATVYLMYHELEVEGRPLCQSEQGYVRYVVRENSFRAQMKWLRDSKIRGVSVADSLGKGKAGEIVITFDDGCETDLTVAAPVLREANFRATFYITVGYLGRKGHLVDRQVRELSDAGFDIGCHSMTHPYLNDLNDAGLRREIMDAKNQLEQITGRGVYHFSCPGGRWSPRVRDVARQAGYHSVATSRIAANHPKSDPFRLSRVVVMRNTTMSSFPDLCSGRGLRRLEFQNLLRATSRRLLGNLLYDRLRSAILERS